MTNLIIRLIHTLILLFSLTACAYKGDFGRTEESNLKNRYNDIVGAVQRETGMLSDRAAYHIPLSRYEHILRQTYKHFKKPYLRRSTFHDPTKLSTFTDHKHPKSLEHKLLTKVRTDINYLKQFENTIKVVIDQDRQRYEIMAGSLTISENDSRFIMVRIKENRAVMMNTMLAIESRIADYDRAITHGLLQLPSREEKQLQVPLDKLRTHLALLKTNYESYIYHTSNKDDLTQSDEKTKKHIQ